jgi:hypothetical protein
MIEYYNKQGITIFDYDYQQSLIHKFKYLPYQITSDETNHLTTLIMNSNKYYHVALCSVNQSKQRLNIYTQLKKKGLNVIDVEGWKDDRDRKIAKAKILVNIHYDSDYQIFEHLRCDRWILSGMLVVSENSVSDDTSDCKDLIITTSYDRLVDNIVKILDNYQEYYTHYLEQLAIQKPIICEARRKAGIHTLRSLDLIA